MPIRIRVRSRIATLLVMAGLSACGPVQAQSALSSINAQSTLAGPTWGPVITGPSNVAATTAVPATVPPVATQAITATLVPLVPSLAATQAVTGPATGAPTATPVLPTLIRGLMGIQAYGNVADTQWGVLMDRSQFMGFGWIKFQLSWKELETSKGQFSQQFDVIKKNIYDSGKRGFKILVSVAKAPDWARPQNTQGKSDGPPSNPQDLSDFMLNLLTDKNIANGEPVKAVEIWNEPNTVTEWTGAPLNGAAYMKLFLPVYHALHTALPNLMILSAGMAPTGDSAGSVSDRTWLKQLFAAGLPTGDASFAIAAHPYGWANAPDARCCASPSKGWDNDPSFFFLDTLNDYRAIMTSSGDQQGKIWVTEFGWASFAGLKSGSHVDGKAAVPPGDSSLAWMNILTEDQQAAYIVRAYQLAQSGDLAGYVGPMFLWNLNFSTLADFTTPDKPSHPESGYSVLNADTFPRAAYNLLQAAPKKDQ